MSSSRGRKSSSKRAEVKWSEWEWDGEYGRYKRWRENSKGEIVWDWEKAASDEPAQVDPQPLVPIQESDDPIEELATTLEDTTLDAPQEPSYSTQYSTQSGAQYAAQYGKGKSIAPASNLSTSPTYSFSRDKALAPAEEPRTTGRIRFQNTRRNRDLDRKYTIHKSKDFKFGKIFRVFWSEPRGGNGTEITEDAYVAKGESFGKVRPFLVVDDSKKGHSLCLPILTYGGQGCTKWGVHAEDHAVIYWKSYPGLFDGEDITKKSIRVEITDPSHKLDPASRLNYAKVYTVEHNVKVHFIGQVAKSYEQKVVDDYKRTHPPLADRPYFGDEDLAGFPDGTDPNFTTEEYPQGYDYEQEPDDDPNYTTERRPSRSSLYQHEPPVPRGSEQPDPGYEQGESAIPHPEWTGEHGYEYETGEGSSGQQYDPDYHPHH